MSICRRRLMIANALKKSDSNINYPGLIAAWSAAGKSNDDADRNVLRDLTGNGHDITLNNFAFSKMSGYGGYNIVNLSSWYVQVATGSENVKKISLNKLQIKIITQYLLWVPMSAGVTFKMRCSEPNAQLNFGASCQYTKISEDTYSVECTKSANGGLKILNYKDFLNKTIEFELLPEYPDALVFDGVDDYGINEEMPIQTDYTIIVKRKVIQYDTAKQCGVITKRESNDITGAFWFERGSDTWSYGISTKVEAIDNDITWQNKTNYNGTPITAGNVSDTNIIHIGRLFKNDFRFLNLAFYSAYLFDRSLDEQEIKAFIRKYIDADYLLPSEIPTPDCYYDFTNGDNTSETRETIIDLSGNGNDAKANNFAWNEEGSGYKDGALQFDGANDNIALLNPKKFRTVFIVVKWETNLKMIYGQRDMSVLPGEQNNAIYTQLQAYRARNIDGITYLNGKKNTHVGSESIKDKKHCITEIFTNTGTDNCTGTVIGASTGPQHFMKMSLYKFLAFKEELTEAQIQYVIEKYNLLNGVDKI